MYSAYCTRFCLRFAFSVVFGENVLVALGMEPEMESATYRRSAHRLFPRLECC